MDLRLMLLSAIYPENTGAECIKDQPEDNVKLWVSCRVFPYTHSKDRSINQDSHRLTA